MWQDAASPQSNRAASVIDKPNRFAYLRKMGSVLRKDGYNVVIRTDDHLPPHVHVLKAGGEVKIALGDDTTVPEVIESWGLDSGDVKVAYRLVESNQATLLNHWRRIHG